MTISKKGAMELSMNTIVIVIISLVILGSGITLLYKFIGGAEDIKSKLDERTDDELERLLVDQGKQVALPLHIANVERGDSHVFGIGILNTDDNLETFHLEVSLSKVINLQEEDITTSDEVQKEAPETWLLYNDQEFNIKESQHYKEEIVVNIPEEALTGQYIFNAKVFSNELQYGNTQKFYVNVK